MNEQLIQRISQCPTLPSLPTIAMQILDLVQRDEVDIAEIARIISKDPALSSKILRTVNSSFYGRSRSISTISHALVILGLQSVKTLVLGFSLVNNLAKNKLKGFTHLRYWRRSIFAATAARSLAAKLNVVQQEECFLAALLMDIGMLVLDQVLGEPYSQINEQATSHVKLAAVERQSLGMTHADVAGMLADMWKLPPLLCEPIRYHHTPEEVPDATLRRLAEVVNLAGRCADVFVDEDAAQPIQDVRRICLETYKIPESEADALLDEICRNTKEVAPLFEINIAAGQSYESILKKANETLVDLTLRMQQEAKTLAVQNEELQRKAMTDALTGLSNRAQLDMFITEQFQKHRNENKPLSLLLLDLDKFKSINDQHGHQAGDEVLKHVGRVLRSAARPQDLAARYGGEELTLVLPGAPRALAATIADTICRALAMRPVAIGPKTLNVTASIGVATMDGTGPIREPAHLLKAADLAVYAAKRAGRNCVRVFTPAPAAKPQAGAA